MPQLQFVDKDEALKYLKQYDGIKQRVFSPDSNYGFRVEGDNVVYRFGEKRDELPVSDKAWQKMSSVAGVHPSVFGKFPKNLVAPLVDHSFRNTEREIKALVRDGEIQGFVHPDLEVQSSAHLLRLATKALGDKKLQYNVVGDFDRNYITIVGPKSKQLGTVKKEGMRVGDIVNYGTSIYNSPLGFNAPSGSPIEVAGYINRLVCMNGAISTMNTAQYTRKSASDGFDNWFTDKIIETYSKADKEFERLENLRHVPLEEHTAEALQDVFREFGVPVTVRDMIRNRIIDHGAHNLYDLLNHITYVASHYRSVLDDPNLMRRLMTVGGNIIQHQDLCPSCHRVIPKRHKQAQEAE